VARLRISGVQQAIDDAVDAALRSAGWTVDDVAVPDWSVVDDAAGVLLMAGAGRSLEHLLARPELISPRTRDRIETGLRITETDEADARSVVDTWRARLLTLLDDHDALALSTLAGPPPPLAEYRTRLTWLTVTFNALGWPGLALPVPGPLPGGLPASVQLVAGPGAEERLLGLGALLPVWRPRT
jgi:amidase